MTPYRVIVADPHRSFREALRRIRDRNQRAETGGGGSQTFGKTAPPPFDTASYRPGNGNAYRGDSIMSLGGPHRNEAP